jgi:hypothetical protein
MFSEGGMLANQQLIADSHLRPAEMFGREGIPAYKRGGMMKYHRGGNLHQHGLEEGDKIIKTIGSFQKVKDKNGKIVYVDLASGYRDKKEPLPFKTGGDVTFKEKSNAIAKKFEGKKVEPKYQRTYGKTYDKEEAKEVGNKIAGKMKATYDKKAFGGNIGDITNGYKKIGENKWKKVSKEGLTKKEHEEEYELYDSNYNAYRKHYLNDPEKEGLKIKIDKYYQLKNHHENEYRKLDDKVYNDSDIKNSKNIDKKALGGLFGKKSMVSNNKVSNLDDKQVTLKNGEIVQVLDHSGDTLMVMNLNKLGSGAVPKRINISEVDMTSFMPGGKVEKKTTKTTKNKTDDKRGGAMLLAKKIRKEGEKWTDAVKRATLELKK